MRELLGELKQKKSKKNQASRDVQDWDDSV